MNPRIQQLAEQARVSIPTGELGVEQWIESYNEKLAELIVRECAAEADKQTIYCRGIPWGKWIKQHFGVDE
jgi:hypothetical protein